MLRLPTACLLACTALRCCTGTLPAIAMETSGTKHVCFTMAGEDCALPILSVLSQAQRTIDVQAFNWTEPRIIAALIAAQHRGVKVRLILDKTAPGEKNEGADPCRNAGIPVWIDRKPKIAHNKVMVIDGQTVVGGSYNYTTNANEHNAENLTFDTDPVWAGFYEQNFERRLAQSEPFTGGAR